MSAFHNRQLPVFLCKKLWFYRTQTQLLSYICNKLWFMIFRYTWSFKWQLYLLAIKLISLDTLKRAVSNNFFFSQMRTWLSIINRGMDQTKKPDRAYFSPVIDPLFFSSSVFGPVQSYAEPTTTLFWTGPTGTRSDQPDIDQTLRSDNFQTKSVFSPIRFSNPNQH